MRNKLIKVLKEKKKKTCKPGIEYQAKNMFQKWIDFLGKQKLTNFAVIRPL